MPLVEHVANYRRIWMFPRNIRRIPPWKIMQIISLLHQQTRYDTWSGNQRLQDDFIKAMDNANLKRPSNLRDSNSGGARTYRSQLECLGLVYKKTDSIELTLAGQDMLDSVKPLEVLQTQLLRHQYPSSYGMGQNVKIHPKLKVKPFLFILQLLKDPEIGYLTVKEIMVPVIYGHNNDCYDLCKRKILDLRNGIDFIGIIDSPEDDLSTPRTQNRTINKALEDVHNISNTCKNYLQGACLINVVKEGRSEKIYFNMDFIELFQREYESKDKFVRDPDNKESFQRAYGAWNKQKDNTSTIQKSSSVSRGENIIKAQFMDYCGKNLVVDDIEPFIISMIQNFGFTRTLIEEVIDPYLNKSLSIFESSYLQLAVGGVSTATEFEKTTGKLFEKKLNFNVEHTGQRYRSRGVGGYSDLFLTDEIGHCAIIDTKASPSYNLPSTDYAKLVSNYIPHHKELFEGRELNLAFCSYIAGGFSGRIQEKLTQSSSETGIPISCLSARNLLKIANDNEITKNTERIIESFREMKLLNISDFMS